VPFVNLFCIDPIEKQVKMQKFGYRLDLFSGHAKEVKTPEELYEAIDKLGPLPLYWIISVNNKQEDDSYDFESAKKEAHIVYEFARRIAESLRKSKQIQTPLPPPTNDPFLGISTIKEWCIDVSQKPPASSDKAGETKNQQSAKTGQNATLKSKIKDFLWTLYEKTLKVVVVDAVLEKMWPK
jgi:hypothetical protein